MVRPGPRTTAEASPQLRFREGTWPAVARLRGRRMHTALPAQLSFVSRGRWVRRWEQTASRRRGAARGLWCDGLGRPGRSNVLALDLVILPCPASRTCGWDGLDVRLQETGRLPNPPPAAYLALLAHASHSRAWLRIGVPEATSASRNRQHLSGRPANARAEPARANFAAWTAS
jgi:hypothetical protein